MHDLLFARLKEQNKQEYLEPHKRTGASVEWKDNPYSRMSTLSLPIFDIFLPFKYFFTIFIPLSIDRPKNLGRTCEIVLVDN